MTGKFKFIAGIGLTDEKKVCKLVLVWAHAGADILDTSPNVMPSVQRTLFDAGFSLDKFDFCISVPINGDIHGKKAKIIPALCKSCGRCQKECVENAIELPVVNSNLCIGCGRCRRVCPCSAIELYNAENNDNGLETFLNSNAKIDTLEVHICTKSKEIIESEFKKILASLNKRKCKISICLSRKYFSNFEAKTLLAELKGLCGKREFLVQADGNSMNGGAGSVASTIETLAFGLFIAQLGYEVILSGGTNEHTSKLASAAEFIPSIAFGSYARKLIYGLQPDEALKTALEFVKKVKNDQKR